MSRIRTVKPDFWTDSLMVQLPPLVRLLYIGMWTAADDYGCIPDEPDRLCMEVMPREDAVAVEGMIDLLIACGRLVRMVAEDGSTYLQVDKWDKHQRVDKPSRSRFPREGSRKSSIPAEARRKVAQKYGCEPGGEREATCYFCGQPGNVWWPKLANGRPGSWVAFSGLELDHLHPEHDGGATEAENLVLSCRSCNRSRGTKPFYVFAAERVVTREPSRALALGKEGKGIGSGEDQTSKPSAQQNAARENFQKIEDKLFEAAGIAGFRTERHPRLADLSPILALIERNYDLEADILPVIRAKARNKTFSTWAFFRNAIIEAAAAKRAIPKLDPAASTASWSAEKWRPLIAHWRQSGNWNRDALGPAPGERGCRVPPELLDETERVAA